MKPYLFNLSRLVVAMAVSFAFAGCTITHTIKSTDLPQLQAVSLLKSVRPKIFAFKEFKDIRGTDARWVARAGIHEFMLDQPVAFVVAMAIRKELERNGHTCVDYTQQIKADFIVEGTVYKHGIRPVAGFFTARMIGDAAVKLIISNTSTDKGILTRTYQGEGFIESGAPGGIRPRDILSQMQLAMVKEMSTDSELIDFLENDFQIIFI